MILKVYIVVSTFILLASGNIQHFKESKSELKLIRQKRLTEVLHPVSIAARHILTPVAHLGSNLLRGTIGGLNVLGPKIPSPPYYGGKPGGLNVFGPKIPSPPYYGGKPGGYVTYGSPLQQGVSMQVNRLPIVKQGFATGQGQYVNPAPQRPFIAESNFLRKPAMPIGISQPGMMFNRGIGTISKGMKSDGLAAEHRGGSNTEPYHVPERLVTGGGGYKGIYGEQMEGQRWSGYGSIGRGKP